MTIWWMPSFWCGAAGQTTRCLRFRSSLPGGTGEDRRRACGRQRGCTWERGAFLMNRLVRTSKSGLEALWAHHHAQWRNPAQIVSQWREAERTDPKLLEYRVRGGWWDALAETKATLLITREYEHLLMAVAATKGGPRVSYLPLPRP